MAVRTIHRQHHLDLTDGSPVRGGHWSFPTSRGQVEAVVQPVEGDRWRFSLLRRRDGRVQPLRQGVAPDEAAAMAEVHAALRQAGIPVRPA